MFALCQLHTCVKFILITLSLYPLLSPSHPSFSFPASYMSLSHMYACLSFMLWLSLTRVICEFMVCYWITRTWWAHKWTINWKYRYRLVQPAETGPHYPLSHLWLSIDRANFVQVPWNPPQLCRSHDYNDHVMSRRQNSAALCPVFWLLHSFFLYFCDLRWLIERMT